MEFNHLIGNIASILLYVGLPFLPMLLVAIQVGRWHDANRHLEP